MPRRSSGHSGSGSADGRAGGSDVVSAYFAQINNKPRLTQEEENFYARQYHSSRDRIRNLLCYFPKAVARGMDSLCSSMRATDLAVYLRVREFDTLQLLVKQLREIRGRVDELTRQFETAAAPTEGVVDDWCVPQREVLVELLGGLNLRDAFYNECCENLFPCPGAKPAVKWATTGLPADPPPEPLAVAPALQPVYAELQHWARLQQEAREAMVEGNLRLVISISRRYMNCGLPFMDLIQEGNIGLIWAVENFDSSRGGRFSTYASYWIKRGVMKALTEQSRTIRLPANMVALLRQIGHVQEALVQEKGTEPTVEEIAREMGVSAARVRALTKMSQQMISLQETARVEDGSKLGDLLEDQDSETPDQKVSERLLKEAVFQAIDTLSERERHILILHYGLDGQETRTLDEIAAVYSLTGERIRQIEQAAIRKLRQPDRRRILDVDL